MPRHSPTPPEAELKVLRAAGFQDEAGSEFECVFSNGTVVIRYCGGLAPYWAVCVRGTAFDAVDTTLQSAHSRLVEKLHGARQAANDGLTTLQRLWNDCRAPSQETLEEWNWSPGRIEALRRLRAVYREGVRLAHCLDTAESHHTDKPGAVVREFVLMHVPPLLAAVEAARVAVQDEIQRWQDDTAMGRTDIIAHYEKILEWLEDPNFNFSAIPDGPNWRVELVDDEWEALRREIDLYLIRVPTPGPRITHANLYEI